MKVFGVLFLLFSFQVFAKETYLKNLEGHYEGHAVYKSNNQLEQSIIDAEIIQNRRQFSLTFSVNFPVTFLGKFRNKSLTIELNDEKIDLKKSLDDDCYLSTDETTKMCFNRLSVKFESLTKNLAFTLNKFVVEEPIQLEVPKVITFNEAIHRLMTYNFNNQISYNHILQARHRARQAYLNLIPHISAGSALSLVSFNIWGFLKNGTDLFSFLFPNRWLNAGANRLQYQAQQDALIISKLNSVSEFVELAHSYKLLDQMTNEYQSSIEDLKSLVLTIQAHEAFGQVTLGTSLSVKNQISMLLQEKLKIESTKEIFKQHLAQALGFMNPEAVLDISFTDEVTIDQSDLAFSPQAVTIAQKRSYELRQIDFLIESLKKQKKALYFSWLDPNTNDGLGVGMGQTVALSKDKINKLKIKRTQIQSSIFQAIKNSQSEAKLINNELNLTRSNLKNQGIICEQIKTMINFSNNTDISKLVAPTIELLRIKTNVMALETAAKVKSYKFGRYFLSGPFSQVTF